MSITSIPPELIIYIGNFIEKKWVVEYSGLITYYWVYSVWDLYATCKSFSWLAKLEYLSVEGNGNNRKIISRNINHVFNGACYQGNTCLIGYYGSDHPTKGYNYSKWSMGDKFFNRSDFSDVYADYEFNGSLVKSHRSRDACIRFNKGSCKQDSCALCVQLDAIQQEIFKKDLDVADIFKNNKYSHQSIIIREKRPALDFKFDYTGFDIVT
jgi:hypothetical protein